MPSCARSAARQRMTERVQLGNQRTGCRLGGSWTKAHEQVYRPGQRDAPLSKPLSHHALQPIPLHGVSDLSPHGDTQPARSLAGRQDVPEKAGACEAASFRLNRTKLEAAVQPDTPGKGLARRSHPAICELRSPRAACDPSHVGAPAPFVPPCRSCDGENRACDCGAPFSVDRFSSRRLAPECPTPRKHGEGERK
jgi:hypothetical protein